jgi:endonuclease YncB( thermonuclease family)
MASPPTLPQFKDHPAPYAANRLRAICVDVKDGDTLVAMVDGPFATACAITVRVAGVNTPELHAKSPAERASAAAAKAWMERWLLGRPLVLTTAWDRSFERWVADVTYWQEKETAPRDLASELIRNGLGSPSHDRVAPLAAA